MARVMAQGLEIPSLPYRMRHNRSPSERDEELMGRLRSRRFSRQELRV